MPELQEYGKISDKQRGEAIQVLAKDLSYLFPISTYDAYEQLCNLHRALEARIEKSAVRGETIQMAMVHFIRAALESEDA
ncbi:MAG: hypothetical protein ACC700_19855 [Anaerolineales bacterium]